MTSLASLRTHTDAIIAALEGAGLVVGDGDKPEADHGWAGALGSSAFVPYVIVYPLPGGTFDGNLAEHSDDATLIWQLTCIGASREQAEWTSDTALAALVHLPLSVAGRSISKVWADFMGGARRDDDTSGPPTFLATPRIRVMSHPA